MEKTSNEFGPFHDYLMGLIFFSWAWVDNPCSPTKQVFLCRIEDPL
jgi:hypothetical protein